MNDMDMVGRERTRLAALHWERALEDIAALESTPQVSVIRAVEIAKKALDSVRGV